MSVREEDRQKNCPGRGLGIAAAAIGVGVGAALYYFFNKRNENPDTQGSTTSWNCETALQEFLDESINMDVSNESNMDTSNLSSSDDSYESHDTTDCYETSTESESSDTSDFEDSVTESNISSNISDDSLDNSYMTISEHSTSDTSMNTTVDSEVVDLNNSGSSIEYVGRMDVDEDISWSPFTISILRSLFQYRNRVNSPNTQSRPNAEIQRLANIREQAFRERSWAVEECSICFEPMHREHEVLALPCTHRFHQPCIMPWLQERQTCPNCRKEA